MGLTDDLVGVLGTAFRASSSNENVATATLNGSILTIRPAKVDAENYGYGEANILVEMVGNTNTSFTSEYGMIHVRVLQDKDTKIATPKTESG